MMPANLTSSQLLYPMGGMSLAYGGGFPEFTSEGFKEALGIIAKIAAGDVYKRQDEGRGAEINGAVRLPGKPSGQRFKTEQNQYYHCFSGQAQRRLYELMEKRDA